MTTSRPMRVIPVPAMGAEDVLVDEEDHVWTGTEDGAVWRIRPDGSRTEQIAHTGGRPLGLELLDQDRLLICDAHRGLLALDRRTARIETLLREVGERPMVFCNNAAVASNGDIWFSDSSTRYPIANWKADIVEVTRTGRLLRRRTDGAVDVVLDGLAFANGVALAADESYVAVAETAARTVARWWLRGPRAGQRDLMVADLPGYPDNIARGSDGLIWVTIASPTDPTVERLQRAAYPLRRAATKVPAAWQPKPKRSVRVQAYDDAGHVVHDLVADASGFHMVTGVREHHGRVWLGSLHEGAVAVLEPTAPPES